MAAVAQNSISNTGDIGNELNASVNVDNHLGATLVVTVVDEKKHNLDRQAVVQLLDEGTKKSLWQATAESSQTAFTDLTLGKFSVEVSAVGYVTERQEVTLFDYLRTGQVYVVLKRDPMAIDLAPTVPLPARAGRETKSAMWALNSNKFKDAQKHLDVAYKAAPDNAHLNFLQGYLSFQQRNLEQAQTFLEKATTLNPRNGQALNLLGRIYLLEKKYPEAQEVLQKAVAVDPQSWVGHHLLGDAYLRQHSYNDALAQAELALASGAPGSDAAEITKGAALADMGRNQEAIQSLQSYLVKQPNSPTASGVRDLIEQIQGHVAAQGAAVTTTAAEAVAKGNLALVSAQPTLQMKPWAPADIDEARPAVAEGVTCPVDQIMQRSGERVKELVDNVAQFSAIEDLLHEQLDDSGNASTKEERKFDYVASISEPKPGFLAVDEFRTQRYGVSDLPDKILTNGFPAVALVFHPDMRDEFDIRCEGLGQLHGQAAWLMHFQQRENRPNRLQSFKVGDYTYAVPLKGRAWISAENFQIVRMETQLVRPMPEIQYLSQHQITEYAPVAFPKKKVEMWLPKTAEIYLEIRGRIYYRKHSFDHFMLFSVDSTDKMKQAKGSTGPGSFSPQRRKKHWWA